MKLSDSQIWESLDLRSQQVIDTLLRTRDILEENLSKQTQSLIQSNRAEHLTTRSLISLMANNNSLDDVKTHLLQSLGFLSMTERRDEICGAHHKTFEWIFRDPEANSKPWSNFVDWLQRGSGIYWINGKAGSGKSTLMRELVHNPKTHQNIKTWSGGIPPKVVSFFFWNSGTTLQRSQIGLFRSLLHEALQDQPDLVPYIFPEALEDAISAVRGGKNVLDIKWNWNLKTLQRGFARLTEFATTSLKFCFFLDGLDEYDGDHESLAEFFKSLSSSPHVKLCVSSRPWLIFEDCFKGCPGLRLQDLTFNDIVAFVKDKLQGHDKMLDLAKENPIHAVELANEIVAKANGVFLWVTLVVRSLLNGLRNGDSISDLRKRLRDLPADLGPFYTHMMDQIEPLYRQQASQIFQTYRAMMAVQGSNGRVDPLELHMAYTACPATDLHRKWNPMDVEERRSRREQMSTHLKSRCAGLLEIFESYKSKSTYLKVVYLHRTVKDFLETEDVHTVLIADAARITNFEPNAWVLMSYITRLRRAVFLICDAELPSDPEKAVGLNDYNSWRTAHVALQYAAKAARAGDRTYEDMLDALDSTIKGYWQGPISDWEDADPLITGDQLREWKQHLMPRQWRNTLLTKAITLGMNSYVERNLLRNPRLLTSKPGRPLLDYALIPRRLDGEISAEMVELLLRCGTNPNQMWSGTTTWQRFLEWGHDHPWDSSYTLNYAKTFTRTSWAHIFKIVLQHGANPLATCAKRHTASVNPKQQSHQVLDVINDLFQNTNPHEAKELRFILEEKKKSYDESRTSQPLLRYKDNRNNRKRHFPDYEKPESRKRMAYADPLYFNGPPSSRDRETYYTPRRSEYDSRSTWHFPKY
jgi:hypothetical protein